MIEQPNLGDSKPKKTEKTQLPETSDIITEKFLSGNMTDDEHRDLMSSAGPEDGDGTYVWWDGDIEHKKWDNGYREYRSKETNNKWQPYKS